MTPGNPNTVFFQYLISISAFFGKFCLIIECRPARFNDRKIFNLYIVYLYWQNTDWILTQYRPIKRFLVSFFTLYWLYTDKVSLVLFLRSIFFCLWSKLYWYITESIPTIYWIIKLKFWILLNWSWILLSIFWILYWNFVK